MRFRRSLEDHTRESTDDSWSPPFRDRLAIDTELSAQNEQMTSILAQLFLEGTIKFVDVDRFVLPTSDYLHSKVFLSMVDGGGFQRSRDGSFMVNWSYISEKNDEAVPPPM
jgi:hypothetical protein